VLIVAVPEEVYLATISITGILLLISLCLLGHLIIFHFYLTCKNLSTYEYIVQMRENHLRNNRGDIESGEISPPKIHPIKGTAASNDSDIDDCGDNISEDLLSYQTTQRRKVGNSKHQSTTRSEKNSPDEKNKAVSLAGKHITSTPATLLHNKEDELMQMMPMNMQSGEEAPSVTVKGVCDVRKEDTGSVESLKEITRDNAMHEKSVNNNRLDRNVEQVGANELSNEEGNADSSFLRKVQSEKEVGLNDSLKKCRRKRTRKGLSNELPPIVMKSKRPLPQLASNTAERGLEV